MISRQPFIQRLIRWRFLMVVNICIAVLLAIALSRETIRSRSIDAQVRELQAQVDTFASRNQDLAKLQTALGTESFIEREARLKLGLKKPGESVVVIQDDGRGQTDPAADPTDPLDLVIDDETATVSVANPTKWWYYFFDKKAFSNL